MISRKINSYYLTGFCKTAELYGINPDHLFKYASLSDYKDIAGQFLSGGARGIWDTTKNLGKALTFIGTHAPSFPGAIPTRPYNLEQNARNYEYYKKRLGQITSPVNKAISNAEMHYADNYLNTGIRNGETKNNLNKRLNTMGYANGAGSFVCDPFMLCGAGMLKAPTKASVVKGLKGLKNYKKLLGYSAFGGLGAAYFIDEKNNFRDRYSKYIERK